MGDNSSTPDDFRLSRVGIDEVKKDSLTLFGNGGGQGEVDVRVIVGERERQKATEEVEGEGPISAVSSVLIWVSVCRRLWFTVSGKLNHTQVQLFSQTYNSEQINRINLRTLA